MNGPAATSSIRGTSASRYAPIYNDPSPLPSVPSMGSRPNVVLVSVDSLRADHCGFVGDDRGLTPFLDRLADDGVVFTNAVAPGPQTFSSMPAVVTGVHRDPAVVRRQPHGDFWERRLAAISEHLSRYEPLQERLREMGYSTAGVSPNPWTSAAAGFDRGFDRFLDRSSPKGGSLHRLAEWFPWFDPGSKLLEYVENNLTDSSFFSRWESFYDELSALREGLTEPYFLWVFVLDTHFPYFASRAHRRENGVLAMYYASIRGRPAFRSGVETPPEHVGRLLRQSYRDAVRSVDSFVEQLWTDVREDDPVLLFHSDHGESLGERGYFGHHHHVFDENVHVPYFVHDGRTRGNVDEPTSLSGISDDVTTIAREGRFVRTPSPDMAFVKSARGRNRALRGRRWKLIDSQEDGPMLFDLEADPDERTNVSEAYPDLTRLLHGRLERRERRRAERSQVVRAIDEIVASDAV